MEYQISNRGRFIDEFKCNLGRNLAEARTNWAVALFIPIAPLAALGESLSERVEDNPALHAGCLVTVPFVFAGAAAASLVLAPVTIPGHFAYRYLSRCSSEQ